MKHAGRGAWAAGKSGSRCIIRKCLGTSGTECFEFSESAFSDGKNGPLNNIQPALTVAFQCHPTKMTETVGMIAPSNS